MACIGAHSSIRTFTLRGSVATRGPQRQRVPHELVGPAEDEAYLQKLLGFSKSGLESTSRCGPPTILGLFGRGRTPCVPRMRTLAAGGGVGPAAP